MEDGTFTDVTAKAGLQGATLGRKEDVSIGAGWFDYNNDGLLDLFVVNYCMWEVNKEPYCTVGGGTRGYCHPRYYAPTHNTLYRITGTVLFTDVSEETGIALQFGKGMSVSLCRLRRRRLLGRFVANDTTRNFLFHNIGGKRFEEVGELAGVAYGANGAALSAMGSISAM